MKGARQGGDRGMSPQEGMTTPPGTTRAAEPVNKNETVGS
jgi:hypothetical protein